MAIKLIFEDGENTPSSILLKNTYYKDNIFFSHGASKLLNKATSIRNEGDIVFMFYDVSPNNNKTVEGYNALKVRIKSEKQKYKDMYLIPIICIEYYICKMFKKYGYFFTKDERAEELIKYIVGTFEWNKINNTPKDSLESIYKNILDLQDMKCLRNHFKYDKDGNKREYSSNYGIFYEKDCVCDDKYCKLKHKDELGLKAERLYTSLPFFVVSEDKHIEMLKKYNINVNAISVLEIKDRQQNLYDMVCDSMHLNRIKVSI